MVQRALGVNDDGKFGPKSIEALKNYPVHDLLLRFLAQRLRFMTNTSVWDVYGKGWSRRICDNLEYAALDSKE
jgi:lysozyme family protein